MAKIDEYMALRNAARTAQTRASDENEALGSISVTSNERFGFRATITFDGDLLLTHADFRVTLPRDKADALRDYLCDVYGLPEPK